MPFFISAPGETDILFYIMAGVLVVFFVGLGVAFTRSRSRWRIGARKYNTSSFVF